MRTPISLSALGGLVALAGCADRSPVAPPSGTDATLARATVTEPASGPWARVVEGRTGPGSLYALLIPTDWNGDAIYFAHGVVTPGAPVALPEAPTDWDNFIAIRDQLGALGYAVAYSSFSENGLAIKDGAQRTHQLRGLLASQLKGQPDQSYLIGYSLGAAASLSLIERFPKQYDGALLMCGLVGGTPLEVRFLGDVRVLFDFFYPDILPGDAVSVPPGTSLTPELQARILSAIAANPLGLYAIASTAQTPLGHVPGDLTDPTSLAFQTLVSSLLRALGAQLVFANDVLERTHGHSPYDNSDVTYTLGTPAIPHPGLAAAIAAANAGVERFTSTPDAQNYLERYYVPSGDLRIPVLTVHNAWDYLVPQFHEPAFRAIVEAAGAGDMLVQRTVPAYGHCANFPPQLVVQSFLDLVGWVSSGVKPAS